MADWRSGEPIGMEPHRRANRPRSPKPFGISLQDGGDLLHGCASALGRHIATAAGLSTEYDDRYLPL
jgi:hypothetical protein